jgi:GGDEF domain-containing protein
LPEAFCKTIALAADSPSAQRLPAALREIPPLLAQAEALALVAASGRSDALAALAQRDDRVDPARWLAFVDGLREKVDELASVLDLSLPQGAAHDEILARAHQQLAGETDFAAADVCRQSQAGQWQETESLVAAAQQFHQLAPELNTSGASLANTTLATGESRLATGESRLATGESPVANASAAIAIVDPGLAGVAARAVAECRRRRAPLSLMLIEFDEFDDLVFRLGLEKATTLVRKFAAHAAAIVVDAQSAELGEGQFALLLHGSDRQQTVAVARRLMQLAGAGGWLSPRDLTPVTLSIGIASVAMPAKNFPAGDLVSAAQRCLFGTSAGGGNGVKSIDIY